MLGYCQICRTRGGLFFSGSWEHFRRGFFLLWNAPDCIKRDVQLYSKNVSLSEQRPPQSLHTRTLTTAAITQSNAKENEKYYFMYWLVQALGSGYTCSFLQFPLSSCTYPTTKSAPAFLPSEGRQSHCRLLSYGTLPIANIDQMAVWQHWRLAYLQVR